MLVAVVALLTLSVLVPVLVLGPVAVLVAVAVLVTVLLLGLASKVLGRDFPGDGSVAVSLSAKFLRPVPVGSEVTVEVKVSEKIERHQHVKIRLYCYTGGKMCVGGEAVVIPPTGE